MNYKVLARKYRPQNFQELIGQDILVNTLKNALNDGRLAHAFLLTGIRGIGKTTTARIIAKAFNCEGNNNNKPTFEICNNCGPCKAITKISKSLVSLPGTVCGNNFDICSNFIS